MRKTQLILPIPRLHQGWWVWPQPLCGGGSRPGGERGGRASGFREERPIRDSDLGQTVPGESVPPTDVRSKGRADPNLIGDCDPRDRMSVPSVAADRRGPDQARLSLSAVKPIFRRAPSNSALILDQISGEKSAENTSYGPSQESNPARRSRASRT